MITYRDVIERYQFTIVVIVVTSLLVTLIYSVLVTVNFEYFVKLFGSSDIFGAFVGIIPLRNIGVVDKRYCCRSTSVEKLFAIVVQQFNCFKVCILRSNTVIFFRLV